MIQDGLVDQHDFPLMSILPESKRQRLSLIQMKEFTHVRMASEELAQFDDRRLNLLISATCSW